MTGTLRLEALNAENWEPCTLLSITPEQEAYVQPNVYILARSLFEPIEIEVVYREDEVIGMIALCFSGSVVWISHLMISEPYQNQGYGRAVLKMILEKLRRMKEVQEVRAGVAKSNALGEYLFQSAGFTRQGSFPDGEIVLRLEF